jgi:hypothetical protein
MVYGECADGAGSSSETEKIFRGAFGLMKFFAERKCPGPRGERGLRGCRGAVGGGTEGDVRELIAKRVCVEYAETAWGIQGEFWDVFARAEHGSDPFVGFCETRGAWRSEKLESYDATALVDHLPLGRLIPIGGDAPKVVARQRREVYGSKDMAVSVGRTIVVGVGEEWYVVTAVERGGSGGVCNERGPTRGRCGGAGVRM